MKEAKKVIEGEIVKTKPKKKSKAIVKTENKVVTQDSAEMLISRAIDKNASVDTMERLLAMRRELKAEYAKEEFDKAMANFQASCPEIVKTKEVKTKSGQVAYRYAPIEVIVRQVKEVMQANGFSYRIQTKTENNLVKSTCIVKHITGHSEETDMEVPLGNKTQVMSDSQVVAAASTFSKRYAFCNAFGILTGDGDNDGQVINTATQKVIPPKATTVEELKQTIRSAVQLSRKADDAIMIDEKTQESKKFDDDFKEEIHKLANGIVEGLNNGK